jgi:hypothetical protein
VTLEQHKAELISFSLIRSYGRDAGQHVGLSIRFQKAHSQNFTKDIENCNYLRLEMK